MRMQIYSESPARASNIAPSPALARDAQALARPVYNSLSELPAWDRPEPVFFPLFPKQLILHFQLFKLFSFVCNGKVIIFSFVFSFLDKVNLEKRLEHFLFIISLSFFK